MHATIEVVEMPFKTLRLAILAITVAVAGCHAQSPAPASGATLPPELAHRVEAMLRTHSELPPGTSLSFGPRVKSELPGYDRVQVLYTTIEGKTGSIPMLVSTDGKTVAQFTTYDISADPKDKYPVGNRPPRGGPASAPVTIVGYDDLECPFCAQLNASIYPSILKRYKDQVHIVYRSFPIEQHPWAMRAAVDTDCLGAQNGSAYWAAVDSIHAQAATFGGTERSLAKANEEIDAEVKKQGQSFHVDSTKLDACIAKQDTAAELASLHEGEDLGVRSTPTLFINGLKIEGAVPLSFLYGEIDNALRAEGKTPPPPYVEPTSATTPAAATPVSSAKPSSSATPVPAEKSTVAAAKSGGR
jgi:protein-disulfide isomerase